MKYLILLALSFPAFGQEIPQKTSVPLKMSTFENGMDLYGGSKSVDGEFLPMGFLGHCTATANGPQTVITAGHCNTTGSKVNFKSRFDGKTYAATCTRHPKYNDRTVFNDWTFCKLNSGSFPADMPLMSHRNITPEIGEKLLLNGYGAPNLGTHFWGGENLDQVADQDLVACGKVYLGGGDSGGTVLRWSDDRSGKSGFEGVAINSRAGGGCSYLNRFSHENFISFGQEYEKSAGVKLCGFSLDCKKGAPSPSPSPTPSPIPPANCQQTYEQFAFCIGTKSVPGCLARADILKKCVI